MHITPLVFKLFILILASPSHGLPVFHNLQILKYNGRNPSSNQLNIRQFIQDTGSDATGGRDTSGNLIVAEASESTTNSPSSKDDTTKQKDPDTPDSSDSHKQPQISLPPTKVDFSTPLDEQMKDLYDRTWETTYPEGFTKVDWLTPASEQLKYVFDRFWTANQHRDDVRFKQTPADSQVKENTNWYYEKLSDFHNVEWDIDIPLSHQLLDNSIRFDANSKPSPGLPKHNPVDASTPPTADPNGSSPGLPRNNPVDGSTPLTVDPVDPSIPPTPR